MNKNILVSVCYRPPDAGPEFIQQLKEFFKYLSDYKIKDLILIGDFNFPSINWLDGSGFSDISSDINFIDSINEAGLRCQNMIDLLFVNDEQIINNIEVVDDFSTCVKSDHIAITFDVHIRIKTKQQTKRTVYNYKKGDFNSLCEALNLLNLSDICSVCDVTVT
jgi:hypothetical protein